ncbi:MAG: hypothetical protein HW377_1290 [Actinobacteria bacterium]|nr:hypothetical protein [Actinomycetota bacterium]
MRKRSARILWFAALFFVRIFRAASFRRRTSPIRTWRPSGSSTRSASDRAASALAGIFGVNFTTPGRAIPWEAPPPTRTGRACSAPAAITPPFRYAPRPASR